MIEQKSAAAQYLEEALNGMGTLALFVVSDTPDGELRVDVTLCVANPLPDSESTCGGIAIVVPKASMVDDFRMLKMLKYAASTALAKWILMPSAQYLESLAG